MSPCTTARTLVGTLRQHGYRSGGYVANLGSVSPHRLPYHGFSLAQHPFHFNVRLRCAETEPPTSRLKLLPSHSARPRAPPSTRHPPPFLLPPNGHVLSNSLSQHLPSSSPSPLPAPVAYIVDERSVPCRFIREHCRRSSCHWVVAVPCHRPRGPLATGRCNL